MLKKRLSFRLLSHAIGGRVETRPQMGCIINYFSCWGKSRSQLNGKMAVENAVVERAALQQARHRSLAKKLPVKRLHLIAPISVFVGELSHVIVPRSLRSALFSLPRHGRIFWRSSEVILIRGCQVRSDRACGSCNGLNEAFSSELTAL
jgi:hypothetical protein